MRLYSSSDRTTQWFPDRLGPGLTGFQCGNRLQRGCLTTNSKVRIHSCEKGTDCPVINNDGSTTSSGVVWITPIITRACNGQIVPELGAGGGGGDLHQSRNLELNDPADILKLVQLCSERIIDEKARVRALQVISNAASSPQKTIDITDLGVEEIEDEFSLELLPNLLVSLSENKRPNSDMRKWLDTDRASLRRGIHGKPLLPRRIVSTSVHFLLHTIHL